MDELIDKQIDGWIDGCLLILIKTTHLPIGIIDQEIGFLLGLLSILLGWIEMDGRMDGWIDGQIDGWIDGCVFMTRRLVFFSDY